MQFGFCDCCGCDIVIVQDQFYITRPGWSFPSGIWSNGTQGILTSSTYAVANADRTHSAPFNLEALFSPNFSGKARLIGGMVDPNNYVYTEAPCANGSRYVALGKRVSGTDIEVGRISIGDFPVFAGPFYLFLCWNGSVLTGSAGGGTEISSHDTPPGNKYGIGSGDTGGIECRSFALRHEQSVRSSCPHCNTGCCQGPVPLLMQVELTGSSSYSIPGLAPECRYCIDLDGTYLLSAAAGDFSCIWNNGAVTYECFEFSAVHGSYQWVQHTDGVITMYIAGGLITIIITMGSIGPVAIFTSSIGSPCDEWTDWLTTTPTAGYICTDNGLTARYKKAA